MKTWWEKSKPNNLGILAYRMVGSDEVFGDRLRLPYTEPALTRRHASGQDVPGWWLKEKSKWSKSL